MIPPGRMLLLEQYRLGWKRLHLADTMKLPARMAAERLRLYFGGPILMRVTSKIPPRGTIALFSVFCRFMQGQPGCVQIITRRAILI